MKIVNVKSNKLVFLVWALFDFLHIAVYSISSLRLGNIPYATDFVSTVGNVSSHGGVVSGGMVVFSWLLELSILVSLVMFLLMKNKVKVLCYVQTPFRLIFLVPSLSIMFSVFNLFGGLNTIVVIVMVILSEAAKVFSLKKWT